MGEEEDGDNVVCSTDPLLGPHPTNRQETGALENVLGQELEVVVVQVSSEEGGSSHRATLAPTRPHPADMACRFGLFANKPSGRVVSALKLRYLRGLNGGVHLTLAHSPKTCMVVTSG